MQKLKNFIYKTMYGRYGVDQFSRFLSTISLVELLLNLLTGWRIFNTLFLVTVIYNCFRIYSKNIYKRQMENVKFLELQRKYGGTFAKKWAHLKQRKTHVFFKCPSCKLKMRTPKGQGEKHVTCPKCGTQFTKRT